MRCFFAIRQFWIVLILILTLAACGGSDGSSGSDSNDSAADDDTSEVSFSVTAHPENTLMAIAQVDLSESASVCIEFTSETTATRQTAGSTAATEHTITVVGMRAQTEYTMTAVATLADGSTSRSDPVAFTTGQLPEGAPTVTLTSSNGQGVGGITFFGVASATNTTLEVPSYWGVDEQGEFVWYLHGDNQAVNCVVREIEPGRLLIFRQDTIRTITTAGEIIKDYDFGGYRYHHDALVLPSGHVMLLTSRSLENEYGTTLVGDVIIELNANGELVWEWSGFDHLDTTRFPGALSTNTTQTGGIDWTHANALFYIEQEDTLLLSVRSQSWVVKIDHSTGNVLWIMGDASGTDSAYQYNDKFFTLESGTWMANQHAPMVTMDGEILIYDNRNESGGATLNSRAVKFALNESAMTAVQTWEAIAPKYTQSLGDVDELSNGNVMMCAGGPGSDRFAHIVEVSPDASAETLWSIIVEDNVYRAERMSWISFLNSESTSIPDSDGDEDDGDDVMPNFAYVVVDTGQSDCYSDIGRSPVPCQQEGEAFYGQDAKYIGPQPSYRDNGDDTVTDLQTNLMWQQTQPEERYEWSDARTYADELNLAGYSDWRLPSIKELYSLAMFYGNCYSSPSVPYLDTTYFSYTYPEDVAGADLRPVDGQYWSSTEYVGTTMGRDASTFGFNFADGRIKAYPNGGSGANMPAFVRCVRDGAAYGQNDFVDNGDSTITDQATELMWMKVDSGVPMACEDALAYAENLEFAGYSDWRLPNPKELQSIVDYTQAPDATNPALVGAAIDPIFDLTDIESWFWTGTTLNDNGGGIYICFGQASAYNSSSGDFSVNAHGAGAQRSDPKTGEPEDFPEGRGPQGDEVRIYNYVRCVRGGLQGI